VFLPQTVKDSFGRVPLFARLVPILSKNLFDDWPERIEFGSPAFGPPITRQLRVRENFLKCVPVKLMLAAGFVFTEFARQNPATDFDPSLHVSNHLKGSLKIG